MRIKHFFNFTAVVVTIFFSSVSIAECTEKKVRQLYGQGKTVAKIALTCDMSKQYVQDILDEDVTKEDDEPPPNPKLMSAGTPLSVCGCWGNVAPQHKQPHPGCQSGYAVPQACNMYCPTGGFAWRGLCGK